jgi:nucleoid-associated protein YgaU
VLATDVGKGVDKIHDVIPTDESHKVITNILEIDRPDTLGGDHDIEIPPPLVITSRTPLERVKRGSKQENKKEEPVVVEAQKEEEPIHNKTGKRRVYIIKEGDTLEKIAFEFYGDREEWKNIFVANRHLMEHRRDIQPGKKIVLP